MKRLQRRLFNALVVGSVLAGALATAQPAFAESHDAGITADGFAFAEFPVVTPSVTAQWWQWAISIPTSTHPLRTDPNTPPGRVDPSSAYCMVGQHGDIWFFGGSFLQVDIFPDLGSDAGISSLSSTESIAESAPIFPLPDITRTCTIPLGTDILMPVINAACNTAEEIYLGNLTGDETLAQTVEFLRSCTQALADEIQTVEASFGPVGTIPRNLVVRRVSTPSPFSVTYAPDHILQFGTPWLPTVNPSLAFADGYWVQIRPLRPGVYQLYTFGDVPNFDFSLRIRHIFTVVGPANQ